MDEIDDFGVSDDFRQRFHILGILGQGAFGVVFEAEQLELRRRVAVKYLKSQRDTRSDAQKRFIREARLLSKLSHPNIVAVFDVGLDEGVPYLVQERLFGKPLDTVLAGEGPLPWRRVVAIGHGMADGLAAAHEAGVVHRDLKPANVFITDEQRVKLLDFGLATAPGQHTALTRTGMLVGTPVYMSPEMLRGTQAGPTGDVYALGTILYEAVCGELPFAMHKKTFFKEKASRPPRPVDEVRPGCCPRRLATLLAGMVALEPERRPTAGAVRDDLAAMAAMSDADLQVSTVPAPVPPTSLRPHASVAARRATLLLVLVLPLLAYLLWTYLQEPSVTVFALRVDADIDTADVTWQTDRVVATGVEYGPVGCPPGTIWLEGRPPATRHSVSLAGLEPGRRYVVAPSFGGGRRGPHLEFSTKPPLAIVDCQTTRVAPTAADLVVVASLHAEVVVELRPQGDDGVVTRRLDGSGPRWQVTLDGLPAGRTISTVVRVHHGRRHTAEVRRQVVTPPATMVILQAAGLHRSGEGPDLDRLMATTTKARSAPRLVDGSLIGSIDRQARFRLDAGSGAFVWNVPCAWYVDAIAAHDQLCFFVDRDRTVHGCRFADGAEIWHRSFPERLERRVFAGDYGVVVWRHDLGPAVLAAATGEVVKPIDNAVLKPRWCVADDGRLWALSEFFDLWSYDLRTGKRCPSANMALAQNMLAQPMFVDDELVVGLVDGSVVAGRPGGARRVAGKLAARDIVDIAHDGERFYAVTAESPGVHAIDRTSGELRWSHRPASTIKTPLLVTADRVYFADRRDFLVCLDGRSGRLLYELYGNVMQMFDLVAIPDGVLFCSSLLDIACVHDR